MEMLTARQRKTTPNYLRNNENIHVIKIFILFFYILS